MKTLTLSSLTLIALVGCADTGPNGGTQGTYNSCVTTSECSDVVDTCTALSVQQVNPATNETYTAENTLCTRGCTTNAECPNGFSGLLAECIVGLGTDVGTCYESCRDDGDCIDAPGEDNWTCSQVEGTTQAVCVPF